MTYSHFICLCRNCYLLFGDNPDPQQSYACPGCGTLILPELEQSWMNGLCAAKEEIKTNGYSSAAREKMSRGALEQTNHQGPLDERTKLRTSANAMKHGAYALKHLLPIARPGELHDCKSCPLAPTDVNAAGNNRCATEKLFYCASALPVMVAFANAHANKDLSFLAKVMGDTQGMAVHALQQALITVLQEGPILESEILRPDKDGNAVECGTRTDPHPALKAIEVFSGMLHGVDLPSWELTPKSTTEKEKDDAVRDAIEGLFAKFQPPPVAPAQLES